MYCECGCGGLTKLIQHNNRGKGLVRGQYRRYIHGHHGRVNRGLPDALAVDDCDANLLTKHYWYYDGKLGYAYAIVEHQRIYLHRMIAGAAATATVIHIDGDPRNNRRNNLLIREKTLVPQKVPESIEDGLGHWLAGFVDGEGCFQISVNHNGSIPSYRCMFDVTLRFDDASILYQVQERTGIGSITFFQPNGRRAARAVRWHVKNKDEALFLTKLFDKFPLRAKKSKDYAIWREAVLSWHDGTKGRGLRGDYSVMRDCRERLLALRREGRLYDA